MIRKFYLVVATIFGLAISSCTNDVNEDIMADASGTLSNTDAEIVELKSGFTITNVYRELDDVVYDGNNNVLTEAQRLELQAALNNGNPTPPSGGRIPNVH